MYSIMRSRKALLIATTLVFISLATSPAFALACLAKPGNTAKECSELCVWTGPGFPICL
ncbi:phage encoded protein PagM [Candidatus Sodalis pierantonius str. SOPE]|uniref:Phage encoded protein PagM n=1 Tax=Candidatus Sodalis pierantonii str. SOPE TaxID=2342 RepID=W0HIF8_9GAMM|nr:phage encoded protein PagM [Candidatus Sodalis pierantonius str. SOPE]